MHADFHLQLKSTSSPIFLFPFNSLKSVCSIFPDLDRMPKTLSEYVDWLDDRDLIWPKPPAIQPVKATPAIKPMQGIRAVVWSIYGTLLRITDGELLFEHPQDLRMQVALDKTIREFKMWHSMTRKPGEPWRQMADDFRKLLQQAQMAGTGHKGDVTEVDSREIWGTIVERLQAKEYGYDRSFYGDESELAEKIAYFYHASLQGVEAAPQTLSTLHALRDAGLTQTLLGNAQCFTMVQLLRALREQGAVPPPGELFAFDCLTLSFQEGVRIPSVSLYRHCVERLHAAGLVPAETLYVGCRLADDLALAKAIGMRTALYAGDKLSLRATKEAIRNPDFRPDRLLTDLAQIREVLRIG